LNHGCACSYLGFGLMAGRAAVLAFEETRAANPCIPADHSGSYEYAGAVHELTSHPDGASFAACSKLVAMVLKLDADCGAPRVRAALQRSRARARTLRLPWASLMERASARRPGRVADPGRPCPLSRARALAGEPPPGCGRSSSVLRNLLTCPRAQPRSPGAR